jgi:hypothetical protein
LPKNLLAAAMLRDGAPWPAPIFAVAVEEKPAGRFMIRSRTRVVKRHPVGD